MTSRPLTPFKCGFVPLTDCAVPVVAREKGFAAAEGIDLVLERSASWAAIRDRVAFGLLDGAHMLAGMPIASTLGLGTHKAVPMVAAMALGRGGNAVTVSWDLYQEMQASDPDAMAGCRVGRSRALKRIIAARAAAGKPQLRFAAVYPFSCHNYELRHWLAGAGIDPDEDVSLTIVPPPRVVNEMRAGNIDGFCVGEPWNQLAVAEGIGRVVATKADICPEAPEKVLGLLKSRVERDPDLVRAVVRALLKAAEWADDPANRCELAALLARPEYVGVSAELLTGNLAGQPRLDPTQDPVSIPNYQLFYRDGATRPEPGYAHWLTAQMKRWGQAPSDLPSDAAEGVYRMDLYENLVAELQHA